MKPLYMALAGCLYLAINPVLAAESERSIDRAGPAGSDLRVFTYTPHRSDCSPVDDVRISVRTPPVHGSLTTRRETVTAGASRFGATDCSGRMIPGLGMYYIPQAGFHGTDRFDYDAAFSNGIEHASVTVTIR